MSMHGLRIDPAKLSLLLRPIGDYLDACWWYLNGSGASIPSTQAKYVVDNEAAFRDYSSFTSDENGYRVGTPGWFLKYIDWTDTDWAMYMACESSTRDSPKETLDWINTFYSQGVDWFRHAKKWELPKDVVFVCRNIDDAYWDLFFRDKSMMNAVEQYVRSFPEIGCVSFVEHPY